MTHISIAPFTMTRETAELLWGQILKDAVYYDRDDAEQLKTLLEELGYDFGNEDFMATEADHLAAFAEGAVPVC